MEANGEIGDPFYTFSSPPAYDFEQDPISISITGLQDFMAVEINADETFTLWVDKTKVTESSSTTLTIQLRDSKDMKRSYTMDLNLEYVLVSAEIVDEINEESQMNETTTAGNVGKKSNTV